MSTEVVLARGGHENNPIFKDFNRGQRVALKAVLTIAILEGGEVLQESDSKILRGIGWGIVHTSPVVWGGAATWNLTVAF